jgi:peptide/nickel transport system substrate-binding protein
MTLRAIAITAAVGLLLSPAAAEAKTLRWAGAAPILTLDPHSSSDVTTAGLIANVYEPLVGRDQNLDLEPGLATKWEVVTPTVWRFSLRTGVKFADGRPFTAEDAKFSIERANPPGGGMYAQFLATVDSVKVVDDATIDIATKTPDPLLPRWLASIAIMSKSWSTEHGSTEVTPLAATKDQHVVRNTNGTGPFTVASWDASSGVVTLKRNPAWWGKMDESITDAVYSPIGSAPTRVAALLSGNVDLVTSLPVQDVGRVEAAANLKVLKQVELRQMVLMMSPFRDVALDTWDNNGQPLKENPWRDVRVRKAVAHAVNVQQIVSRVMQGFAKPTALPTMAGLADYQPDMDVGPAFDPDLSKRLLAEAGYPNGFKVRLRCTNDRYPNDEAICRAVSSMLARAGIDAQPSPEPWSTFAKDLLGFNMDFILLAAAANGQTTYDMLQGTWMTREGRDGQFNWLRWSDKEFDTAVNGVKTEFDPAKRKALIRTALQIAKDKVAGVFLHQQMLTWGATKAIEASLRPDGYVILKAIQLQ